MRDLQGANPLTVGVLWNMMKTLPDVPLRWMTGGKLLGLAEVVTHPRMCGMIPTLGR